MESQRNKEVKETVGTKISDFKLLKELGKGSYGTIYTVKSYIDDNIYVMKKMELNHLKEKQQKECYREVSILRKVSHPNIIKYYSSFLEKENLYIIMEYAEMGDLYSLIKHYKRHLKYFDEFDIWRIASEILNGLNYLHSHNIIHRDIKCLNLFLTKDKHVKIGDLGVSTIVSNINALHCTRVGTPLYLSPELVKQIPYDYKVDIWSFGCSLYHLCMLEPPFSGDNLIALGNMIVKGKPKLLPSQYSNNLISFIDKMLCKKPEKRPSAKEALVMIPSDIMEKIREANRNNVEIKNRPFSSIGNKVVCINKDEIGKIKEKIQEERKEEKKEERKEEYNEKKNEKKEKENIGNDNNNNLDGLNNIKNEFNNNDNVNNEVYEKNKSEKRKKVNSEIINIKNKDNKNSVIQIFADNLSNKPLTTETSAFKNKIKEISLSRVQSKKDSNLFKSNSHFSKFNFNTNNSNQNKLTLPFANKINNKQEKSIRVFAQDFKQEIQELQKEKNKKTINESKENNKIIEDINLKKITNASSEKKEKEKENEKRILTDNINNMNNKNNNNVIENKILENITNIKNEKREKPILNTPENKKESFDLKFPNLEKNIPMNQYPINLNGFKRILSSKHSKTRSKSNRPYTASTNRMLLKPKNQSFRPISGFPSYNNNQINNNVINININFFNIDMNQKFLDPYVNNLINNNNDNDYDISFIGHNNKKRPMSHSKFNLKEITGNTNEFFFSKIIKTLEEAKGTKRLTVNDIGGK